MTYELASEKEKELIKLYNCKAPFGYNLTDGGEGTLGIEVSEEIRQKRSENMSGSKNITAKKSILWRKNFRYYKWVCLLFRSK